MTIRFEYHRSTCAGKACISETRYGRYTIKLNVPLFAHNDDSDQIDNTVGHEIAHLVAFAVYGDRGHGKRWKSVMIRFGLPPERCHSMNDAARAVGKNTTVYAYHCAGCGKVVSLGAKRHKRQLRELEWAGRGAYSHCRGHALNFVKKTDKITFAKYQSGELNSLDLGGTDYKNPPELKTNQPQRPSSAAPAQAKAPAAKSKGKSKLDICRDLFDSSKSRADNITMFVEQAGATKAGAATYYAKIKKEI